MAKKTYDNTFVEGELIDLADMISLVSPTDTPLYTLVAGRGQVEKANDITVTWREKALNTDRGTLIMEGAEAGDPIKSTRSSKSNIAQIMEKVTSVSGTVRALAAQGIGDEFMAEIEDRMVEMKRDAEWYFLNGTKTLEDDGTSTPRQMDGLLNLVANAKDLSGKTSNTGVLEEADMLDVMQNIWDAGAQGEYFCFLNAGEKRIVNDILKNGNNTRLIVEEGDNVMGVKVSAVDSDFGTINFVLDRHMASGQMLFADLDLVRIAEVRSPFYEDLAKTGDFSKGHVVAENTIKLLNSQAGGKIIGINE
jgi:hypothetical protein